MMAAARQAAFNSQELRGEIQWREDMILMTRDRNAEIKEGPQMRMTSCRWTETQRAELQRCWDHGKYTCRRHTKDNDGENLEIMRPATARALQLYMKHVPERKPLSAAELPFVRVICLNRNEFQDCALRLGVGPYAVYYNITIAMQVSRVEFKS